jgi:hypothetical protein
MLLPSVDTSILIGKVFPLTGNNLRQLSSDDQHERKRSSASTVTHGNPSAEDMPLLYRVPLR